MRDPYSILGISKDASDEEVKAAYRELARKYHPDNYGDDNPLKDLAEEKMQEINAAYAEIEKMRANNSSGAGSGAGNGSQYTGSTTGVYADVRRSISARRFADAERELAKIPQSERTAEWHYLMSVLLMHRGRPNDAIRELEIACNMDPSNMEYQHAKEWYNNNAQGYGSAYYGGYGRRSSQDEACNCCANLLCMDCLCECCGGDLIPCL